VCERLASDFYYGDDRLAVETLPELVQQ